MDLKNSLISIQAGFPEDTSKTHLPFKSMHGTLLQSPYKNEEKEEVLCIIIKENTDHRNDDVKINLDSKNGLEDKLASEEILSLNQIIDENLAGIFLLKTKEVYLLIKLSTIKKTR